MIASFREGSGQMAKWVTNKDTLEFIGIWKKSTIRIFITQNLEKLKHTFE